MIPDLVIVKIETFLQISRCQIARYMLQILRLIQTICLHGTPYSQYVVLLGCIDVIFKCRNVGFPRTAKTL